ncbi:transcriptional regulator [Euzebyella marina]|uniref:Transcriptional regulator n=1 Tax=Euzebyella marina TaxID=1761453 RepID=A0A3G2L9L9_9FLAO|nr:helix-turn-helix domain-containing protein [Euzebyella marina]AYN68940.1 transcriptional regulator [Euzebyella marina]MAU71979.1 HxlR family transcriptional regulator [Pseudozobellia sp.]MBG48647.1 HxlR family transcriptional regulator [Pseudozobellia sp.]|tara:strand:+ start:132 stop:554 length:423 start_codon:yes stop_codon:yes gene_type:complete
MQIETVTEKQRVNAARKLKKMFGGIDYTNMPHCPIRDVMAFVSDKWSTLIILHLGYFPVLRFNELKKKVFGVSNKVLSERLKQLEGDGYVQRTVYPEVPIRVEYNLTDFGHSYLQKLIELTEWAENHKNYVINNRENFKK